jgi:uncharacterized protein (PEP-CTERM system associated)
MASLGAAGIVWCGTASAADWRVTPSVTLQEVVTDNAEQTGTNAHADAISQFIPSLNIVGESPRGQLSFSYAPIFSAYLNESGQDRVDQNLETDGSVNIVDRLLTVNFNAFANQGSGAGSFGSPGASGLVPLSDRTLNYGGTIAPHLQERFGDVATLDAFYRVSTSNTSGSDQVQTDFASSTGSLLQQDAQVIVGSGESFGRLSSQLSLDHVAGSGSGANNDFANDTDIAKFEYHFTNTYALTGYAGYQRIHYDATAGLAGYDNEGPTWSAGVKVTPNDYTTFELSYGRQSGGYSVESHIKYDLTPRTHISADYTVAVENQLQANLGNFQFSSFTPLGSPVGGSIGNPIGQGFPNDGSQLFGSENTLFRDKVASISFVRQFTRSSLTVTARNERRLPLSGGGPADSAWYGNVDYTRELTPSLRGDVQLDYSVHSYDANGSTTQPQSDRLIDGQASLIYSISPTLSANVSYSYFRRISNLESFSTTTNEFTIGIRKDF